MTNDHLTFSTYNLSGIDGITTHTSNSNTNYCFKAVLDESNIQTISLNSPCTNDLVNLTNNGYQSLLKNWGFGPNISEYYYTFVTSINPLVP